MTTRPLSAAALGLVMAGLDINIECRVMEHNRYAALGDAEKAAATWLIIETMVERKSRLELDALRRQCVPVASYPVRIGIGDNLAALYPERGL